MSLDLAHAVFHGIAELWSLGLALGYLVAAVRARSGLERVVAVDVLGLTLAGFLALVAFDRAEIAYLDGTLALVLLSFAGTAAAARLALFRRRL